MTQRQKFIRWYVGPFNRLKRMNRGDGAFVAMSMGFSLCERYYRIKSGTINRHWVTLPMLTAAAKDYNCNVQLFQAFWDLFRNGIQHQGAPKKKYTAHWLPGKPKIRIKWVIGDYLPYRPAYLEFGRSRRIGINPWKFTRFILHKFLRNEPYLRRAVSHSFGSILPQPRTLPTVREIPFK